MIRKATINDLDDIYLLCDSEPFKWSDNEPPYDKEWLSGFIINDSALCLVYESDNILKAVMFGEKLITNGMLLWVLAVKKEFRNNIIGPKLYIEFEQQCKNNNIEWIYTLGYKTTEDMLLTDGYKTNGRMYKEFVKNL